MREIPYASVVGSLMYAMVATRLDLSYVIGVYHMLRIGRRKSHV